MPQCVSFIGKVKIRLTTIDYGFLLLEGTNTGVRETFMKRGQKKYEKIHDINYTLKLLDICKPDYIQVSHNPKSHIGDFKS